MVHSGVEQRLVRKYKQTRTNILFNSYHTPCHNLCWKIALCIPLIIVMHIGGSPLHCIGD